MKPIKRLPDTEFDVMRIAWRLDPPVTTMQIISKLGAEKNWSHSMVQTLLARLVEKGFLATQKEGKERNYTPIISQDEYMQVEAGCYIDRLNEYSALGIVAALYDGKDMPEKEIAELQNWLAEKRKK
jgi:predicted transcriptional regulator